MPKQHLACGPFQIDVGTQTVRRDGELISLGNKAVLLLEALFSRPGDVLTKTELIDAAWQDLAVEESNLSVQIAALRKALGPGPGGGEWIVTVPRVGYRFVLPAAQFSPAELELPSIAVLPFVNLSSDPEQAFFADGLAEEIIVALGKLPGLVVIARNSSFAYRGSDIDVRKVGGDLNVPYVLSGSVRRGGSRLRVSAQLANSDSGAQLWAETYDRELADVFAIQDEVTQRIIDALRLKISTAERVKATSGGTGDVEALDLVMRARVLLAGPTQNLEVYKRATQLLRRAIDRDARYVDALGALSLVHHLDYVNRWSDDPDRSLVEAGRLADRMIQLVPEHAGGHYQAAITALFARDFDRFRHEGEIAIALSPGSESASNMRGQLSLASETPLNAVPHFERAMRLDPGTTLIQLQLLGMAYFFGGRYETAAAVFRERILMMPDTDWSRAYLASALGHLGKLEEARQVWTELMEINPSYSMAERLHRNGVQPRHIDMVLEGARKAGLPV